MRYLIFEDKEGVGFNLGELKEGEVFSIEKWEGLDTTGMETCPIDYSAVVAAKRLSNLHHVFLVDTGARGLWKHFDVTDENELIRFDDMSNCKETDYYDFFATYSENFSRDLNNNTSVDWGRPNFALQGKWLSGESFEEAVKDAKMSYGNDPYEMTQYPAYEISEKRVLSFLILDDGLVVFKAKRFL